MEQLFDENILIGSGWTAYESLRPLAYSTLADLVHHVRQHLPLNNLSSAVAVFSRNVHDESLPASIQTMSCKLLLNLVECIRTRSDQENGNGRELLIRMLEVFVLKFKTIAKCQLPVLMQKRRTGHTRRTYDRDKITAAGREHCKARLRPTDIGPADVPLISSAVASDLRRPSCGGTADSQPSITCGRRYFDAPRRVRTHRTPTARSRARPNCASAAGGAAEHVARRLFG
ncbi:hypothetical protein HPB50_009621 [Hyalomma asiaticum]|uniref:Uncharacterized protein n=1 Tax=Hyalomma asiaticum TaxID=266040 RepID=A0ACB7SX30_HYAAI|nr:hypothetical protein HPB50_009621 [Hyalomma asiaticum]